MNPVRKVFDILESLSDGQWRRETSTDRRRDRLLIVGAELGQCIQLDSIKTADVEKVLATTKPSARAFQDKYTRWQQEFQSVWNLSSLWFHEFEKKTYRYIYLYIFKQIYHRSNVEHRRRNIASNTWHDAIWGENLSTVRILWWHDYVVGSSTHFGWSRAMVTRVFSNEAICHDWVEASLNKAKERDERTKTIAHVESSFVCLLDECLSPVRNRRMISAICCIGDDWINACTVSWLEMTVARNVLKYS